MSDDLKARTDLDPAAQVAQELRARLRGLPPDQIVELCAQLLNTYVVEGVLPLARAGEGTDLAADGAGAPLPRTVPQRLPIERVAAGVVTRVAARLQQSVVGDLPL